MRTFSARPRTQSQRDRGSNPPVLFSWIISRGPRLSRSLATCSVKRKSKTPSCACRCARRTTNFGRCLTMQSSATISKSIYQNERPRGLTIPLRSLHVHRPPHQRPENPFPGSFAARGSRHDSCPRGTVRHGCGTPSAALLPNRRLGTFRPGWYKSPPLRLARLARMRPLSIFTMQTSPLWSQAPPRNGTLSHLPGTFWPLLGPIPCLIPRYIPDLIRDIFIGWVGSGLLFLPMSVFGDGFLFGVFYIFFFFLYSQKKLPTQSSWAKPPLMGKIIPRPPYSNTTPIRIPLTPA